VIKKLGMLVLVLLALHFLAVGGAVGYLVGTGKLTGESAGKIKEALFPPVVAATQPSTQPSTQPAGGVGAGRPLLKLEELMARQAGRPATEQVEFIRNAFDQQVGQVERRMRELEALERQIETARAQLARDRADLASRTAALDARESAAARLAADEGFQNELQLYLSMPAAQVKKVFMGMEDSAVARFLQAMPPRTASKILKEFKTPEETTRVQLIMERVRRGASDALGGGAAGSSAGANGGANGAVGAAGGGADVAGGGAAAASETPAANGPERPSR
jgi:flagellar motility protein MotE (MotC chaperone)